MSAADDLQIKLSARDQLTAKLKDARGEVTKLEKALRKASDELAKTGKGADKVEKLAAEVSAAKAKVAALGKEAKETDRKIEKMSRSSVSRLKDMANQAKKTGASLSSMASTGLGHVARGAGIAGLALGALTFGMSGFVGASMNAQETQSKFNTVFGESAEAMEWFVESQVKAFGMSRTEMQNATAQFGIFAKAAQLPIDQIGNFSASLVMAGEDISSFYNVSLSDALLALQSGLAGEAEPLRRFGIFLSEDLVQAAGVFNGVIAETSDELTDQQKVMLRQKLIMAGLGDAQGDLTRTSDSAANQIRAMKGEMSNAAVEIGDALLPSVLELVKGIRDQIPLVTPKLTELAQKFGSEIMPKVADLIPRVADLITKFVEISEDVMPVLVTVIDGVGLTLQGFGIIIDGVRSSVQWLVDVFRDAVSGAQAVGDAVGAAAGSIGGAAGKVGGWLNPFGDTTTPRSRSGNVGANLASHASLSAGVSGVRMTSSLRGFALGSPWSDHLTGAAADYQGANLPSLANVYRRAGGFAEFHGSGADRHLHAVAPAAPRGIGDAAMPATRRTMSAAPAAPVAFGAGSIVVSGAPGMSEATIARLVRREVAKALDGTYR